ncbi:MAG: phospholipase D-like domain-containing protein, partial [Chloroflexota bacterium]
MTRKRLLHVGATLAIFVLLFTIQINSFAETDTSDRVSENVIINEWSQGVSGRKEWVELLVIGKNVSLAGWDLGDESAGDLHFASVDLWQNIPAGTLIVIYNGVDRDDVLPEDDADYSDWRLVVSSQDESLFHGSWGGFTNSNPTDYPQLRNSADVVVHSLTFLQDNPELAPNGNKSLKYVGDSEIGVDVVDNWINDSSDFASPGIGNSNENHDWINSLKTIPEPVLETNVIMEKVLPNGLADNDLDEAILIANLGSETVDLAGWGLSDDLSNLFKTTFPENSFIEPGQSLWVTKNAVEFSKHFGFKANFELDDSGIGDESQLIGNWPGFSNMGDEVLLTKSSGEIADALVYESGDAQALAEAGQWVGESLDFYSVGTAEGQILFRKRDPVDGTILVDSNQPIDWGQDQTDPLLGQQVQYPGWDSELFFRPAQIVESSTLTVVVAPDNAFEAVSHLIDQAKESIQIEAHTFESHELLNHLKEAANRGVNVVILLEGSPPGGVDDAQRWNCFDLAQVGGSCFIMQNEPEDDVFDRYNFLHAKFMIIDGRVSMISSDNLSPNSLPSDDKNDGTFGRRGVALVTDASAVAQKLNDIFQADLDEANHHDILEWAPAFNSNGFPIENYQIPEPQNGITYSVEFQTPVSFEDEFVFEVIQAPENYLNPSAGLMNLLDSAGNGDTLLIQQQYERLYWGDPSNENVRLVKYVEAARRGAAVKIMLDDYFDDSDHPASNQSTCSWVNGIASDEELSLQCRTGNPTGLGVHNKMVLAQVNGEGFVHVGSINGSEQSAKLNREVALQVKSDGAYEYLASIFNHDFPSILFLPAIFSDFKVDGNISYPLINEVLYNPIGAG